MLQELTIRSFALIDELILAFGSGLNIITGETGSGKSIVIDALGLALGERASAQDVIRTGADRCVVEAVFSLDNAPESTLQFLRNQEFLDDDSESADSLIISRELTRAGKNTARINGRLAQVSLLRQATNGLVDIHGQNEHQTLLAPEHHIDLLDHWLGIGVLNARAEVVQRYSVVSELKRELAELTESSRSRALNLDLYRHQKNEIESAALKIGEDEELTVERNRLANSEKLHAIAESAYAWLSDTALDGLNAALSQLEKGAVIDPDLQAIASQARDALSSADDAARALRNYRDSVEFDPGRLEEIDDRLELIRNLKRKYGDAIEEIVAYGVDLDSKLFLLDNSEAEHARLTAALEASERDLSKASSALSKIRNEGSSRFAQDVANHLRDLAMGQCAFEVSIEPGVVSSKGADSVQFVVSTNPGEPLKPLAKVASGGELSRLMLALKSVLSSAHSVPTLVFDEIDVGVGGRTAQAIGQKLLSLSKSAQVFCITHLAQIASLPADCHISIEKRTNGGRTSVHVESLTSDMRVGEIARMLGGREDSSVVVEHAKELLASGAAK